MMSAVQRSSSSSSQSVQSSGSTAAAPAAKLANNDPGHWNNVPPTIVRRVPVGDSGETKKITYRKVRFLGKGGFARVYEYKEQDSQESVAIKIIPKANLENPRAKQKLLSEIRIHRSLDHPCVVKFLCFLEDRRYIYLMLEMCGNNSLLGMLKKRKRLTEPEVRYYLTQLCDGLHYLRTQNVIHRDLKLGNLFLNDHLQCKIGDFGLAARVENAIDRRKTICGTPNYIAPEVLMGDHSFEVDVWSVGVIMYTLLVGTPPFQSHDLKSTYRRITSGDYAFPPEPHISDEAKHIIQLMLTAVPEQRPSFKEVLTHPFFTGHVVPSYLPPVALERTPLASKRPAPSFGSPSPTRYWEQAPSPTNRLLRMWSISPQTVAQHHQSHFQGHHTAQQEYPVRPKTAVAPVATGPPRAVLADRNNVFQQQPSQTQPTKTAIAPSKGALPSKFEDQNEKLTPEDDRADNLGAPKQRTSILRSFGATAPLSNSQPIAIPAPASSSKIKPFNEAAFGVALPSSSDPKSIQNHPAPDGGLQHFRKRPVLTSSSSGSTTGLAVASDQVVVVPVPAPAPVNVPIPMEDDPQDDEQKISLTAMKRTSQALRMFGISGAGDEPPSPEDLSRPTPSFSSASSSSTSTSTTSSSSTASSSASRVDVIESSSTSASRGAPLETQLVQNMEGVKIVSETRVAKKLNFLDLEKNLLWLHEKLTHHVQKYSAIISGGSSNSGSLIDDESSFADLPDADQRQIITCWIDSRDYGLGYFLLNGAMGSFFNDQTVIVRDQRSVQYIDQTQELNQYSLDQASTVLKKKMTILNFFEKSLIEQAMSPMSLTTIISPSPDGYFHHLYRYTRTRHAMIFWMTNGTLQVNFFADHTKIFVWPDLRVTFIDKHRKHRTYHLANLKHALVLRRLEYLQSHMLLLPRTFV